MRIEDLAEANFNEHWLVYTRKGELKTAPKDPLLVRWLKFVFDVLTFCLYDIYGHVRIRQVAEGLFAQFQSDMQKNPEIKEKYITVIDHLLHVDKEHTIRTDREVLLLLKEKMRKFP